MTDALNASAAEYYTKDRTIIASIASIVFLFVAFIIPQKLSISSTF